jgi:hypothetical protein
MTDKRTAVALSKPATSVAPFVTLTEAVADIHREFQRVVDAHEKHVAARIRCGVKLLALKARIEGGEAGDVGWWAWYSTKFARDRRDAERVMEIADAQDSEAAHEAEKAATRERMRALRARPVSRSREQEHHPPASNERCAPERVEANSSTWPTQEVLPPNIQHDLIAEGLDVFRRMNRPTKRQYFVELRNAYRER